jgi:hypothetical protein
VPAPAVSESSFPPFESSIAARAARLLCRKNAALQCLRQVNNRAFIFQACPRDWLRSHCLRVLSQLLALNHGIYLSHPFIPMHASAPWALPELPQQREECA